MLQKIWFFDKKDRKLSLSELLSRITRIQIYSLSYICMTFYVNPSWACTLFRSNKQHVVLEQKRKCQRVEESGLWWIQRERWIEVKYIVSSKWNKCRIYEGDQLDRWNELKEVLRVQTRAGFANILLDTCR